ncbi:hypothetical protein Tco_0777418 [Tanacetum coccineum]
MSPGKQSSHVLLFLVVIYHRVTKLFFSLATVTGCISVIVNMTFRDPPLDYGLSVNVDNVKSAVNASLIVARAAAKNSDGDKKETNSRSQLTSSVISATVHGIVGLAMRQDFWQENSLGKSFSSTALDIFCTYVLKSRHNRSYSKFVYCVSVSYSTQCRNVLYLMTAFEELVKELFCFVLNLLVKELDWEFIRKKRNEIAFLYGDRRSLGSIAHA